MRIWVWLLVLFALAGPLAAQTDEDRAISEVVKFLNRIGEKDAAGILQQGWKSNISIGPTRDGDNAQTDPGTPQIRFNTRMVEQILSPRGVNQRAVADWAATFIHERRHTAQSKTQWAGSYWQNVAGQGHPCEAAAWGDGFQAYQTWLERAQDQLKGAKSEKERVEAAKLVRDLSQGFKEYYQNYPKDYGGIRLDGRQGPLTLNEALEEATAAGNGVERYVGEETFATGLSPRQAQVRSGESVTFTALPKGGVPGYSYHWSVNGQPIAGDDRSLTRQMTASETVTVEVWDVRGRKVSASSQVTVDVGKLSVELPASLSVRPGEEFTLGAKVKGGSKPFTYQWTSDGKTSTVNAAGLRGKRQTDSVLTVTVTDARKQTAKATCRVEVQLELATAPSDQQVAPDQPFTLSAKAVGGKPPYSYAWKQKGTTVGSGPQLKAKVQAETSYTLEVRDARGQLLTDSCRVTLGVAVMDGVYTGRFRGVGKGSESRSGTATAGMMTMQVRGGRVTGRVSGSYGGDGFTATFTGAVDGAGNLNCSLNGKFTSEGGFSFTGWIRGRIANQVGRGQFGAANSWDTPTGTWEVAWRSP